MENGNESKVNRRSFLQYALAGGAATGIANLTIMKDLFAQAPGGPIVIGHHCEQTGGFASWGYWHDPAARKAVELLNKSGGIAKRKVELVTEDTESNPATGARKLRNLIQRSNAEFVMGSVHSGVMLASIPIATELKTIYMSMGSSICRARKRPISTSTSARTAAAKSFVTSRRSMARRTSPRSPRLARWRLGPQSRTSAACSACPSRKSTRSPRSCPKN